MQVDCWSNSHLHGHGNIFFLLAHKKWEMDSQRYYPLKVMLGHAPLCPPPYFNGVNDFKIILHDLKCVHVLIILFHIP